MCITYFATKAYKDHKNKKAFEDARNPASNRFDGARPAQGHGRNSPNHNAAYRENNHQPNRSQNAQPDAGSGGATVYPRGEEHLIA
jgi:hypothetical protein